MRPPQIQHRLRSERHRLFVGREAEQACFLALLDADALEAHVVYVHGPGGVGKTALLCEYQRACQVRELRSVWLDCRSFTAGEGGAEAALARALGAGARASPWPIVENASGRWVLLMDNFDVQAATEPWIRSELLPRLSADCLVVIASRTPPSQGWRMEGGWGELLRALPLGGLSREEAETVMARQGAPATAREAIYRFAGGHPLGLSLISERLAAHDAQTLESAALAEVSGPLLETVIGDGRGGSPEERTALEVAALLRRTTEDSLAEVLGDAATATRTFEWLRSRSFMEHDLDGIHPADLVRSLLVADLRWRSPEGHASIHRRLRRYLIERIRRNANGDPRPFILEYLHLNRERLDLTPVLRWPLTHGQPLERALGRDRAPIVEMVQRHEGARSAQVADALFEVQPESFLVFRGSDGTPAAFLAGIRLDWRQGPPDVDDPGLEAAWGHLCREAPLRTDERAVMFRFWMAREAYQRPSPLTALLVLEIYRLVLFARNLAFHITSRFELEDWRPMVDYLGCKRIAGADFQLDGRRFEASGHDWRKVPVAIWLEQLAEQDPWPVPHPSLEEPRAQSARVLDQATFKRAVRDALRALNTPRDLMDNPLLHSRLVVGASGSEAAPELRVGALERILFEAVEDLRGAPRLARCYRALHRAYLNPAETQELAAESLGLSYSTFRRHLAEAVERVSGALWKREIQGDG